MPLATAPPPGTEVPEPIIRWARAHDYAVEQLTWLNELGDITARLTRTEHPTVYAKWSERDLIDEAERLSWLSNRFPSPVMADYLDEGDGSLVVTIALADESAVSERWKQKPEVAARAIGEGLARLHSLDPADCLFGPPEWVGDQSDVAEVVIIHGDPCAPNTIIDDDGRFAGIVDLGSLGVADRWADLAIASWSLEWNFGPGYEGDFWDAYGESPDPEEIARYRDLWEPPEA